MIPGDTAIVGDLGKLHCTTSLIVEVWVIVVAPDVTVAVTVTVEVPAGVPGSGGGLWPEPPQPTNGDITTQNSTRTLNRFRLRREMPKRIRTAIAYPARKGELRGLI
jgi:hypothetical protein